jgi:cell division protein FtsL
LSKLNLLLLAAVLGSSLLLVNTAYESRRVFAALDLARKDALKLDAEFQRLDAERQAQATHLRVERVAREKLRMRTATPAVTAYVPDPTASGAAR